MIKNQQHITILKAVMTLTTGLVIGYLDGYTFIRYDNNMISAQTGNLVVLGVNLAAWDVVGILENLILIAGFGIGTMVAFYCIGKTYLVYRNLLYRWTVFVGILLLTQFFLHDENMVLFLLSLLSGVGLSFFRDIGSVSLNSTMMTGNFRMLYINFVDRFIFKNKAAKVMPYVGIALVFLIGAFVSRKLMWLSLLAHYQLIVVVSLIPYIFMFIYRKKERTAN